MKGIYALGLVIINNINVKVGALSEILFREGKYIYVGSALNSLEPRLVRHIKKSRGVRGKLHWHIDYLLVREEVELVSIHIKETLDREECKLAEYVGLHGIPVKGFGCSDCRCKSHLFIVKNFKFLEKFGMVDRSKEINLTS